ncbi:MAG TPA: hypothetical protein VLG40_02050 [Candidatus Saccharimonas sp.]|nr:hypothetical protein [Candidatus Saccharimonas sp.]
MTRNYFVTTVSLVLVALVLISSAHAAQVFGATVVAHDDGVKKISHDDTSIVKTVGDLHHHSDKTGSQLIKDAGEHQLYADSRSLRLHHKKISLRVRASRWLRLLQTTWSATA